jgi:hypothetical protein
MKNIETVPDRDRHIVHCCNLQGTLIICTIDQLQNIPKQVYCKDQKTRVSPDVSPTTKSILMYINARYD